MFSFVSFLQPTANAANIAKEMMYFNDFIFEFLFYQLPESFKTFGKF
jgi:hypothetical protein